jgi:hypothetical protein
VVVRQGRAPPAGQQPEPVLEPVGQLLQRDGPQPPGGQLDGQRNPVQAPAEPDHAVAVGVGDGETGHHRHRALGEQLDRVAGARGPGPPVRHRQRRDRAGVLAGHRQRLPAGGEHGDDGRPEQDVGQHGARVDQVLAGVQDQQHSLVAQVLDDRVELGPGFGAG